MVPLLPAPRWQHSERSEEAAAKSSRRLGLTDESPVLLCGRPGPTPQTRRRDCGTFASRVTFCVLKDGRQPSSLAVRESFHRQ